MTQGYAVGTAEAVGEFRCYVGAWPDASGNTIYYGSTYDGVHAWSNGIFGTAAGDTIDVFNAHAGKLIAITNSGWGFRFGGLPSSAMTACWARGVIPALSMNWGAKNTGPFQADYWTNDQIANGDNDAIWTTFFNACVTFHKPFFLLPCVEMNGSWTYEGGLASDGTFPGPNNPANFVSAWLHLKALADSLGATNATWVWCPNAINPTYDGIYDAIEDYYPGDTDWLGIDLFSFSYPEGDFSDNCQPTYSRIQSAVDSFKPILLSQISASSGPSDMVDKAAWISGMATGLPNFSQIRAFSWFDWHAADSGTHDSDLTTPYDGSRGAPPLVDHDSIVGMDACAAFRAMVTSSAYVGALGSTPPFGKVPLP